MQSVLGNISVRRVDQLAHQRESRVVELAYGIEQLLARDFVAASELLERFVDKLFVRIRSEQNFKLLKQTKNI